MRRLFTVMNRALVAFLLWLSTLVVLLSCDCVRKELQAEDPFRSYFFFVLHLPLYALVLFGCYALITIGWHLLTISKTYQL